MLYNIDETIRKIIYHIESEISVKFVEVRHTTDLIALPSFLSIVNPCGLSRKELEDLFDFIIDLGPYDSFYLFTDVISRPIPDEVQSMVLFIPGKITKEFLINFIVNTQNSVNLSLLKADPDQGNWLSYLKAICSRESDE